jgi:hypothetical protein
MALIYRPHTNIWQYRHTGSELALSARSAAMGRAVIAARAVAAGAARGAGILSAC